MSLLSFCNLLSFFPFNRVHARLHARGLAISAWQEVKWKKRTNCKKRETGHKLLEGGSIKKLYWALSFKQVKGGCGILQLPTNILILNMRGLFEENPLMKNCGITFTIGKYETLGWQKLLSTAQFYFRFKILYSIRVDFFPFPFKNFKCKALNQIVDFCIFSSTQTLRMMPFYCSQPLFS